LGYIDHEVGFQQLFCLSSVSVLENQTLKLKNDSLIECVEKKFGMFRRCVFIYKLKRYKSNISKKGLRKHQRCYVYSYSWCLKRNWAQQLSLCEELKG